MTVEPIRDRRAVKAMQNLLKARSLRDWLLFNFGINTGLRIGDILRLKVSDIVTDTGRFKQYLTITEEKTGKVKKITLNDNLRRYVREYLNSIEHDNDTYLFASRKGGKPITRVQAYRILKDAAECCGIEEFGTHSMRKTWGYHSYKETQNIALIMDTLNHTSQAITMRYIGINQDAKDALYSQIQF